jgi:bacteriocin-like protein
VRELNTSELSHVSGGTGGPLYLDATGLNLHLLFAPVAPPVQSLLTSLLGNQGTPGSELRVHLGYPITPAPGA